jgi:hypothetical protein
MARIVDAPRVLFSSLAILAALAMACGHGASARDRLSGDVERVKMIGFTVGDLDRDGILRKSTAVRESLGFSHCGK